VKLRVKDLPPSSLLSVSPATKLADVARDMRIHDSDSIAVIDDERLVGIITERDLVRAIADGLNPTQASAGMLMTSDPATVRLDEDVNVVAVKMMRLGIRHLPVVDEQGKPAGLVSARNLIVVLDRANS
jgi:CBS domain-containing protein